ncbi:MAG: TIM barrel protein [Acidimicrobiales bacterium]
MSTALATLPLHHLAAAPISWGICEVPGWGEQLPRERVLKEMAELGFAATELGAIGYLPEQPNELVELLRSHRLSLVGGFVSLVLHDQAEAQHCIAEATRMASLIQAVGGGVFITAAVTTWEWARKAPLSEEQWRHLYQMLDRVDAICEAHDLKQAIHPHLGTVLESSQEVQRVLDHSTTGWTLDTGHLAIGGYDPLQFVHDYADRIRHVHLKDVHLQKAVKVLEGRMSILDGVRQGMFCSLGGGDIALDKIVEALESTGFDGWYVIEQDVAITGDLPEAGEGPILGVQTSVEYLRNLPKWQTGTK